MHNGITDMHKPKAQKTARSQKRAPYERITVNLLAKDLVRIRSHAAKRGQPYQAVLRDLVHVAAETLA